MISSGQVFMSPSILNANFDDLENEIAKHDLVISLIPYTHHARVIDAAVKHKKHVVTTSYISPAMQAYHQAYKRFH